MFNFIYPNVCGFCNKILQKGYICDTCKSEIHYMGFSYVPFLQNAYYDEFYCNYKYEGIVRKRILDYKFEHKKYLCKTFAEGMLERFKKSQVDFDIIVSVPIHQKRKKERGYNQCELIAKILSQKLYIPYEKYAIVKEKTNSTQSKLNKEQRLENVKNVFEIKDRRMVENKCVLLIDDIFTTGATVNECSKVLKKAGAKKVIVYTVAKATVNSHRD